MNDFFNDSEYKIPETSNYLKFIEGENVFRALSSAIVGYEYFTNENKPVRSQEPFDGVPSDIKKDGKVKHFWAFVCYSENTKRIQILEVTQSTIMKTMQAYIKNPKWGNPREYDFIVTKTGSGMDTEYAVSVNPKAAIDPAIISKYESMNIDLTELYVGGDPFKSNA